MSRAGPTSRRPAKGEYIETDTGNKISRRAHIDGKAAIMLGGKTVIMAGVHMRGDLCRKPESAAGADGAKDKPSVMTAISIGRSTIISQDCVLRPPLRLHKGQMSAVPMRIGDNVFVGAGSHVAAASIGSGVHIGPRCVLSPLCIVKEGSRVLADTVVPPGMTVPAGCVVAGRPARIVGEVPDGWGQGGGGAADGEEGVEGGDLRPLVRSIR